MGQIYISTTNYKINRQTSSNNLKTNTSTFSTKHTWLNSSVIYSTHINPQKISRNHKLNTTIPSLKCTPMIMIPQPLAKTKQLYITTSLASTNPYSVTNPATITSLTWNSSWKASTWTRSHKRKTQPWNAPPHKLNSNNSSLKKCQLNF